MSTAAALILMSLQAAGTGFTPARLLSGEVNPPPWGTAVAGTAAMELTVDATGAVTGVEILDDLEPFTSLLREGAMSWRFEPATLDRSPVESRVLIGGLFRPAMLLFPDPGPPSDLVRPPSEEVPFPTDIEVAPYPPTATGSVLVLVEVAVDARGNVANVRATGQGSPFSDAAVQAARNWKFRAGRRRGRSIPGNVYAVFSFLAPH